MPAVLVGDLSIDDALYAGKTIQSESREQYVQNNSAEDNIHMQRYSLYSIMVDNRY
jgi:hypothetical protein